MIAPFPLYVDEISPLFILPVGKFICMLVRNNGSHSMIILDLINREELAEKMAEKLNHVDLRDRFMHVYAEVISHPENHRKFRLVVGNGEGAWSSVF